MCVCMGGGFQHSAFEYCNKMDLLLDLIMDVGSDWKSKHQVACVARRPAAIRISDQMRAEKLIFLCQHRARIMLVCFV